MNDDRNVDFKIMNPELRARLIEAVTDEEFDDLVPVINSVPDGTKIVGYDDEIAEDDLPPADRVALMIDYYWGNFA